MRFRLVTLSLHYWQLSWSQAVCDQSQKGQTGQAWIDSFAMMCKDFRKLHFATGVAVLRDRTRDVSCQTCNCVNFSADQGWKNAAHACVYVCLIHSIALGHAVAICCDSSRSINIKAWIRVCMFLCDRPEDRVERDRSPHSQIVCQRCFLAKVSTTLYLHAKKLSWFTWFLLGYGVGLRGGSQSGFRKRFLSRLAANRKSEVAVCRRAPVSGLVQMWSSNAFPYSTTQSGPGAVISLLSSKGTIGSGRGGGFSSQSDGRATDSCRPCVTSILG